MDHLAFLKKDERFEKLSCVQTNFLLVEAHKLVLLDMCEQVCVEQLEDETLVLAEEGDVLVHAYDSILVRGVLAHKELEKLGLLRRKLMVIDRISIDLYGNLSTIQVINRGYNLGKAAFTEYFYDLKAIKNVVFRLKHVIPFSIIIICHSVRMTSSRQNVICIVNHAISQIKLF